jgi:phosphoribosyl-ATP pyrophosphohydrolase/phosphoribosyl-AMP cyclohydrolase
MLAYANQDGYDYMHENGETYFWSRSRQKLCHKHKTFANVQQTKSISFDCDNDMIVIQIEQTGIGAYYMGSYSFFGDNASEYEIL